ncbi:MAG: LacI family DNA-binding transcriptional regulator [Candidatus Promineofilum sp.]|nr:LacI family DNA-binding transcriptional regulator [Promineifilum sp.]
MATVTIRDVAKRAGVGIATVSRVLNKSPLVSDETRHRVLAAIADLDYSPSAVARRLSRGKSMAVAVIAPFFTRRSYVERLQGIENVLSSAGYDLILYNVETVARRDECLRTVPRGERLDGLLILSLTPDDAEAQQFAALGVPAVLVDAYHPALPTVQIDDVAGAGTAVRYLIDLGHQRIAFVGETLDQNPLKFQPIGDRYHGYRQTLDEAGIPHCPEYHRQGKYGWREARRMAHELLDLPQPPTAIFAYSDTMAFGVLEAAQQRGVDVPGHLSVIGFDDVEIAQYFRLTTVRQPLHESGARGAELLLECMDSDDSRLPPGGPHHVVQPTELVVRSTTGPPLS